MVGINTKDFLIKALGNSVKTLNQASKNLASGRKAFSQDAAAGAIVAELEASASQSQVAIRNGRDAQSILALRESGADALADINVRKQELALQASNGTLSDAQRSALDQEFQALTAEGERIVATTEFNGQSVFNSTSIQVGTDSSADSRITLQSTSFSEINQPASIATQSGALSAVDQLGDELNKLSEQRASDGAAQSRIDIAINNNEQSRVEQTAAAARLADIDVAEEVAKRVSAEIRANTTTSLLAQANQSQNIVKSLLG